MTAREKLKKALGDYRLYDVKCASIDLGDGEKLYLKLGYDYDDYVSFMNKLDNYSVVFGHVWLDDYIWLETNYEGDFIYYVLPTPPKECRQ